METYFYGQGKLFSAAPGVNKWAWWGDVSSLTFSAETETKVRHRESYSGLKATVRKFDIGLTATLAMTLHQMDPAALARFLQGTVTDIAGGSVSVNEVFPNPLAVGDIVKLAHPKVSSVVLVDSTGSPVTLTPGTHYSLEAGPGSIEILSLAGLTQPLQADAYTYAAYKRVALLNAVPATLALRYEGINLAEGNAPVVHEWYKVSTELLQNLALITDGTDVAGMDVNAEVLLDTSKLASDPLGQFGRVLI